jgi:hypothetical protein
MVMASSGRKKAASLNQRVAELDAGADCVVAFYEDDTGGFQDGADGRQVAPVRGALTAFKFRNC